MATPEDADMGKFLSFSRRLIQEENIPQLTQEFKELLRLQRNSVTRECILTLFRKRDIRAGDGRRQVFLSLFKALHEELPDLAEKLVVYIPFYGSWKDVFQLAEQCPGLQKTALEFAATNFRADEDEWSKSQDRRKLSLVAKWAPREGKRQHALAVEFAKVLFGEGLGYRTRMTVYRRRMATMNYIIRTVEVLECAGRWNEIRPEEVPERALNIKRAAYLNTKLGEEDERRKSDDTRRIYCSWNFQDAKERLERKLLSSVMWRHDRLSSKCFMDNRYNGPLYEVNRWLGAHETKAL